MISQRSLIVFLFFLLLPISSCSFFTKKVESLASPVANKIDSEKNAKKNLFCHENNKIQILLEDESTLKEYHPLIPKLFETKSFSFIQKAALLSLAEMSRRPDQASPTARLQVFLRLNNNDYYFDFRPKKLEDDTKMSYLKGVDFLLKRFDKSKTLLQLSDVIDQSLPAYLNVSPKLEKFLQTYKNNLSQNELLSEAFLKGDEVLTKHESFKRIRLKRIINLFNSDKISKDSFYEFSKNPLFKIDMANSDLNLKCNFNINNETSLKEDLFSTDQKKSHYFSLKDGNNFFIAVSSVIIQGPFNTLGSTYFIKSRTSPLPLPVCQFKTNTQDIVLFSSSGRTPSQHLKHLLSYEIDLADSFPSLEDLLKFSRHLFLNNPDRILYESKRGRKSQLDFFLNMNFPVYHVEALGDIIGIATFKNGKHENKSLIADDRSKARLWCAP